MPPKRCPECGRFLSNEFVASLADASLPCPRCETPLEADALVGGARSSRRAPRDRAAEPRGLTASAVDAGPRHGDGGDRGGGDRGEAGDPGGDALPSVRPPDLDPSAVRAPGEDVLAGWDEGVTVDEVGSWRVDRRPFPTDVVVVVGAALIGGVLGAAVADRHRPLGAALGVLGGVVAAGIVRRVWELEG